MFLWEIEACCKTKICSSYPRLLNSVFIIYYFMEAPYKRKNSTVMHTLCSLINNFHLAGLFPYSLLTPPYLYPLESRASI